MSAITTKPLTASPKRILACVRCSSRKLKCDRHHPCGNCSKSRIECISAAVNRPERRRRFPERQLLDRILRYEALLQQHNIDFESLHSEKATNSSLERNGDLESKAGSSYERDFDVTDEQPDTYDGYVVEAMNELDYDSDHLLLLFSTTNVPLSNLRPSGTGVLKLWQIYVDRIDPIFKVTHSPTLQATIIASVGGMKDLDPSTDALMFAIYCTATLSMTEEETTTTFGTSRADLLRRYQAGCRCALSRAKFLRTEDRNCLTALFLYMVSVKPEVDRRSLSTSLGTMARIAQGMGIHSESANAKCSPFEAEMRRRLWWAIVLFDNRVCEGTQNPSLSVLLPTWNCKPPSNCSDFEIRPDMVDPPIRNLDKPSEALYVVVRSRYGDFLRTSDFHLDLINPALKPLAQNPSDLERKPKPNDLNAIEHHLTTTQLSNTPSTPLQYLTTWTLRSLLAKSRLLHHYWKSSRPPIPPTDSQRDQGTSHALAIIECEANLVTSPLTQPFRWHISHFPFPAYVHVVQDLKRRPGQAAAERAWEMMSEDFRSRFAAGEIDGHPVFRLFGSIVVQAWEARGTAGLVVGMGEVPWIVGEMRRILAPSSAIQGSEAAGMIEVFATEDVGLDFDFDFDQFLPNFDPLTASSGNFAPGELDWNTPRNTRL